LRQPGVDRDDIGKGPQVFHDSQHLLARPSAAESVEGVGERVFVDRTGALALVTVGYRSGLSSRQLAGVYYT
jgi:hypothetical protein